jgi:acetyltransferase
MIDSSTVATLQAKDGRSFYVRPLQPDDTVHLISIFDHMGSDSRYQRFHQSVDNLNPQRVQQEADQIASTMLDDGFGLIAFADDTPIGAARYVVFAEGRAEMAVSIRDDYQNNGIGTFLVELLAQEAKQRGLQQLTASVQASNKVARRLLEKLPFLHEWQLDGPIAEAVIDLSNGR